MRKSSVAFSSGKSTSLRAALSAIVIAAVTLLSACDAWGTIDNPVDPQSPNYQGYPTVSNADEIKPATPINGEVFFACPTLVAYKVVGATSYDFQIRLSSNDWTPLLPGRPMARIRTRSSRTPGRRPRARPTTGGYGQRSTGRRAPGQRRTRISRSTMSSPLSSQFSTSPR